MGYLRLALAVGLCLVLLAGVLWQPLSIRSLVRAYDRADTESPALRERILSRQEPCLPALIDLVLRPDCLSRERLVSLIQEIAPEEVGHHFIRAFKESSGERRLCALRALGYLDSAETRLLVEQAMRSDDPGLQQTALEILKRSLPDDRLFD